MKLEIRDSREKDWFWLDNEYLNGYAKFLGVYCTAVYISLCRHSDNNTQTCYPSMSLIASENGMSVKTVERSVKTLEDWGIIRVQRSRKEDGTQANNVYTLTKKSLWKEKPENIENNKDRQTQVLSDKQQNRQTLRSKPTDSQVESRQTQVLHNYTHINYTHNNNTASDSSEPQKSSSTLGKDIGDVIKAMESVDAKNKLYYGNKTQRSACTFLLETYGKDAVLSVIEGIPKARVSVSYFPSVTTPCELRDKWTKIFEAIHRQNKSKKPDMEMV